MNHDETVVRALAMGGVANMMKEAAKNNVCPDCLLKEVIILTSLNVLVKEVVSLGGETVTSDNVDSFCSTIADKLEALLDKMDSGEVAVNVMDVVSGEFVGGPTKH